MEHNFVQCQLSDISISNGIPLFFFDYFHVFQPHKYGNVTFVDTVLRIHSIHGTIQKNRNRDDIICNPATADPANTARTRS